MDYRCIWIGSGGTAVDDVDDVDGRNYGVASYRQLARVAAVALLVDSSDR